LDFQVHSYALGAPEMRAPEYRSKHPLGRVPTLEDGDITLFESGAIIQYLLAKYGDGMLTPTVGSEEFAQYLQWFHYAEGMLMPPMNSIVVETILLPPDRRSEAHAKRATKLMGQMLGVVDARLEGREYLAGPFTAAEFMTGHAVIMAQKFGADLSDKPNIMPYTERLMARPALQKAWQL
jgi:glutathione S-transferase